MAKKTQTPAKLQNTPAKLNKTSMATSNSENMVQMKRPTQGKTSMAQDPQFQQTVQNYETGLRAMQERKFEKAKGLFQKVAASGSRELADRAKVHLSACEQHLSKSDVRFRSAEEHYDYAISLMNIGDYVTAREHLEKLVKESSQADYIWYGLAVLDCLTGHVEDSLKRLSEAIRLNPANRFQARSDTDFKNMADDPRFTELLYPEPVGGEEAWGTSTSR